MKKLLLIILILVSPTLANAQWEQMGEYITGREAWDGLGFSASISADGNTFAVTTNPYGGIGFVTIYRYVNNKWSKLGHDIVGNDGEEYFSTVASLDSTGEKIAIGTNNYWRDESNNGFVKVYHLIADNWIQLGDSIVDEDLNTYFGTSVKLSSNGKVIAIESKCGADDTTSYGFLKIFELIENQWVQKGSKIVSENPGASYGDLIELSSNGEIVTFGIPLGVINGNDQSKVKVFEFLNQSWKQLGQDIDGIINNVNSPASLDLNADGTTLIIGEQSSTVGKKVEFTGEVNVYKFYSDSWSHIGQNIYGESSYLGVGRSSSISADGTIIAISTPGHRNEMSYLTGKVDIYKLTANKWEQLGTSIEGERNNEDFGGSLDLSSDGLTILIGAPRNDSNGTSSGQVRIFRFNPETSVYESADDESILVYPNPTKNEVNIQFTDQIFPSEINLVDITGKQIYTKQISGKISKIDISDLINGIYFIHIKNSNGVTIKKVIKE